MFCFTLVLHFTVILTKESSFAGRCQVFDCLKSFLDYRTCIDVLGNYERKADKMRPLYLSSFVIALLTSTIACTGGTKVSEGLLHPPETIVRQADGGKIFKLHKGDEIVIHLKGNRTTGYSWAIEEVDDNVLGLVNDVYIPDKPAITGSGGVWTVTFKAVSVGASPVRLKYWRPWEGESSVVERFEVTVRVGE